MVRILSFFRSEISEFWQMLTAYRPERHYMRGPGPKWREKYAALDGADDIVSPRSMRGSL